jgi:hypothetical protein
MRRSVFCLLVAVSVWLVHAEAVTRDNFLMRTTQDLVDVCSVQPGEPLYEAAVGFCHGFGVGAYQYYQAERAASASDRFVCPPVPVPARVDIVQWLIAWAPPSALGQVSRVVTCTGSTKTRRRPPISRAWRMEPSKVSRRAVAEAPS